MLVSILGELFGPGSAQGAIADFGFVAREDDAFTLIRR